MVRIPVLTLLFFVVAAPAEGAWTEQHSIWGNGNNLGGVAAGSGLVAAAAAVGHVGVRRGVQARDVHPSANV